MTLETAAALLYGKPPTGKPPTDRPTEPTLNETLERLIRTTDLMAQEIERLKTTLERHN